MKRRGSIGLFLPPGATNIVSLLVEPGPALGFGKSQLDVHDQWGSLLATALLQVKRQRTRVQKCQLRRQAGRRSGHGLIGAGTEGSPETG